MKIEKGYVILMADVIDSRKSDQKKLMSEFKKIVAAANQKNREKLLSPMTITLGDEFQGVAKDVKSALEMMIFIEEKIIEKQAGFRLRYVLLQGTIDTPLNKVRAHAMLGDGLTAARETLEETKNSNNRFNFSLKNKGVNDALNHIMFVYQCLVDGWNKCKDYSLVTSFLELKDYKKVAEELGKTRSQMWKRQKNLKIEEYFSIKEVLKYIVQSYRYESNSSYSHHHPD